MERKYKHPQINLRLLTDLKDKIQELAECNNRSVNQKNGHSYRILDIASFSC
ncbi:Arc family DNA-binding protein [Providencia sp. PROV197]|uniref:Arc family DNA-binding protein n=1 Tax=Providencia sp. PROV197 TaxID=2949898 RepID=UPI003FA7944D